MIEAQIGNIFALRFLEGKRCCECLGAIKLDLPCGVYKKSSYSLLNNCLTIQSG